MSATTASILITNFNLGRFLPDAIDSALAQTWPNVQVVVVDDGSTDHSRLLIESYGDQVTTLFKENGGQASAFEAGLPLLTGDATILLDADDMLDPTAIEKTIGFFVDPNVVKVHWPIAIVDALGHPTGEVRVLQPSAGNFRDKALRVGPASHTPPPGSGNFWRTSFVRQVLPAPGGVLRNVVDAHLFTFSPFFGDFQTWPEPLTFYRVHGSGLSTLMTASVRLEHWEKRAELLDTWLRSQGTKSSIERWRRNNRFHQRLSGIVRAQAHIGKYLPTDALVLLVAGPYYDRKDFRPLRPVFRPPATALGPDQTDADFRALIADALDRDIAHIAVQGSSTWRNTNLEILRNLLHDEHDLLYENQWIVLARISREHA